MAEFYDNEEISEHELSLEKEAQIDSIDHTTNKYKKMGTPF
ncbi:hypothetical protein [Marinilactibacillus psychrotolerans]|uniref:Uncharacterized protein n=2 Tax=Marinilactibacillus psychrotolerans TaxID=191770 RepID=A0AAV3WWK4_9LACT|nr:hypothetical protein [Marinilactibacillus psychrotolerans]GEL67726.1 hypothetical protein MPS01_18810 [Marinilactibacillus psychrotolerans]GEQ36497.1 hypothetical protein M132T_20050 [Marinilactibacillus psychrotolerans]SDD05508.1 hypothetical protein SAMN04488013_11546 [Marinilactibacillus psychrotolerans]SJN26731.1 hypothetical protein FM115_03805 [Marinilactibacillus psychrotolerans 42ea]